MDDQDQYTYPLVPATIHRGLVEYVRHHRATGGFLRSVLTNDLHGAVLRADWVNRNPDVLRETVLYVQNELPVATFGSAEAYRTWTTNGCESPNCICQRWDEDPWRDVQTEAEAPA